MKKPNWWDKPITWGTSVIMSLISIPISLIWVLIWNWINEPNYTVGYIQSVGQDIKDWTSDLFDKK